MDADVKIARRHWFHYVSYGILSLFMLLLLLVTAVAFSRRSGSTGLDMAQIQQLRYDSVQKESQATK